MTTQRIQLSDEPSRFHFKVGDKVVMKGSDGYADPEYRGAVVEGTWEGDPAGGSYNVAYRVKRDRGSYFDARDISLLRRFDDEAALRQGIRSRFQQYKLPQGMPDPPPGDELEGRETMRSPSADASCSACDHKIPPREQGAIEYAYADGRVVRFHARCNAIWIQELRRH